MKKKFLTSMFAFALMLPCFALFAACGPTNDDDDGDSPTFTAVTYEQAITKLNTLDNFTANATITLNDSVNTPAEFGAVIKIDGTNFSLSVPETTELYAIDGITYSKDATDTAYSVVDTRGVGSPSALPTMFYGDMVENFKALAETLGTDTVTVTESATGTVITIKADFTTLASQALNYVKIVVNEDTLEAGIDALIVEITGDDTITLAGLVDMVKDAITTNLTAETTFDDLFTLVAGMMQVEKADLIEFVNDIASSKPSYTEIDSYYGNETTDEFGYGVMAALNINDMLELKVADVLGMTADEINAMIDAYYGMIQSSTSLADFVGAITESAEMQATVEALCTMVNQVSVKELSLELKLNFDASANFTGVSLGGVCSLQTITTPAATIDYTFDAVVTVADIDTTTIALPSDMAVDDVTIEFKVTDFDAANPVITLDNAFLTANFEISADVMGTPTTFASYDVTTKQLTLTSDALACLEPMGVNAIQLADGETDVYITIVFETTAE